MYVNFFFEDQSIVSSNNRQILETGLSSNSVCVFSCTEPTNPFFCQDMSEWWPLYHQQLSFYVVFSIFVFPEAVEDIPLSNFSKWDQTGIELVVILIWCTNHFFLEKSWWKKWFWSSESFVIEKSLRMASAFFTRWMRLSHMPPWCNPAGLLKVHVIPSDRKECRIFVVIQILQSFPKLYLRM